MVLEILGLFGRWLFDNFLDLFAAEIRVVVLGGVSKRVVDTFGASAHIVISGALAIILLVVSNTRQLSLRVVGIAVVTSGVAQGIVRADHAHPLGNHLDVVLAFLVSSVRLSHIGIHACWRRFFPSLSLLELLIGVGIACEVPGVVHHEREVLVEVDAR